MSRHIRDLDKPMKHVERPPAWTKSRNVGLKGTVNLRTILAAVVQASDKLGLKYLRLHDLWQDATSKLIEMGL